MIEFQDLASPATILAPSHMHAAIRIALLENRQGSAGIQIQTIDSYILSFQMQTPYEELDILLQYRKAISTYPAQVYAKILHTLDFLKQCAGFLEEMKLYGIPLDSLPQKDAAQREMKDILSLLYPIPTNQDLQNKALEALAKHTPPSLYIMESFYSAKEAYLISYLEKHGARQVLFPKKRNKTAFYHAINKRKEVEAAAQFILREKRNCEDINIVVCDPSYKPLIKQVFHRYRIPSTILKSSSTSILVKRFTLLLSYAYQPDRQTLFALMEANTFPIPHLRDFVEYMQVFQKDIFDDFHHIEQHAKPSQLISEEEIERLYALEQKAQEAKEIIFPALQRLLQTDSIKELFLCVNEIASSSIQPTQTQLIQTLKKIHHQLVLLEPYMQDRMDLPLCIDVLSEITESASSKQLQGIWISDLLSLLPPRSTCMIFGCTQKSYPAFPAKKGLFDEAYVQHIPLYPAMRDRYDQHMKQLTSFLETSPELIVSYPLGSYDGKGNEAALEMEQLLAIKAMPYPLSESYEPIPLHYQIDSETARQLFVKENKIHGSISAFERYQRCPFSYFLNYGLRLKEPIDVSFSQSKIGTLSHYVLEYFVNRYGKEYTQTTYQEVEALLSQELQSMANVYPSFQIQIDIVKKRMLHSIMKNLAYLQDMEEHSHIAPYQTEYEFWWELPVKDAIAIRLHGFIDRIDASSGYARIIDYKSSSKQLSQQDVFAGLQLQLITYALLAEKEFQKTILGAYYYSMKNENIPIAAGRMTRRPVAYQPFGMEEYKEQEKAAKKLRGWTMHEDAEIIDDDASHIYGLRLNKDGDIKIRTTYDLSVIKEHFSTIYAKIGTSLLQGNIDCTPTSDACMFCPYAPICRFKGYPRVAEPIVELDDTIYKGGE